MCHTTSGGADHIHAHMEEWLQTEWGLEGLCRKPDRTLCQVAVVGPNARKTLEKLGGGRQQREPRFYGMERGHQAALTRAPSDLVSGELSYEVQYPQIRVCILERAFGGWGRVCAALRDRSAACDACGKRLYHDRDETDGQ